MTSEAERLATLRSYDILDTDGDAAFNDFVHIAAHICQTPIALVSLVDEGRQWFAAAFGTSLRETPIAQSVCAHAIRQDGLFVVSDLSADPRFADNPLVTQAPNLRFYGGAVLRTADGIALGSMCVLDQKARPEGLNAIQQQTLEALSRQVMTQLELRRALHERRAAEIAKDAAYAQAQALLAEKDLLMQEVDHRVKNSLATVQSLLRLQARMAATPETAERLQAAAGRIQSFSALHEYLYTTGATTEVDLAFYLLNMIDDRHTTMALAAENRRIHFSAAPLPWPAAEAPTIGLILIELLTNALKYGAGTITITLLGQADTATLSVTDQGAALSPGSDPAESPGFGMRIVTGLLKSQNRGRLELDHTSPTTRFVVTFQKVGAPPRTPPTT